MNGMCARGVLFAGAIGAAAALTGAAAAGPLRPEWVSPDATWVVHIDAEAAMRTELGQCLLDLGGGELRTEIGTLRDEIGIDPFTDVFSVTAFAAGEDDSTVGIIVEATTVVDDLLQRANEFGEQYRSFTEGDKTIHTWQDDDKTVYAYVKNSAAPDRRLVLVSMDLLRLRSGMLRLEARGMGAEVPAPLENARPSAGSFLFVSASEMPGIEESDAPPLTLLMQNAKRALLDVGEAAGRFTARASLDTGNAQAAQDAVAMFQGFVAMGRMAASSEPDIQSMLPLLNGLNVSAADGTLLVRFEYDSASLMEMARSMHAKEHGANDDGERDVEVKVKKKVERRERVQ